MAENNPYGENVVPIVGRLKEVPLTAALHSGGGGGTFDDMEGRVAALEKAFERQDAKLDKIGNEIGAARNDLSYLKGKVDSMPTTLQLLLFVLGVLGIAGLAKYFT